NLSRYHRQTRLARRAGKVTSGPNGKGAGVFPALSFEVTKSALRRKRLDGRARIAALIGRTGKPRVEPRIVAPDVAVEFFLACAGENAAHFAGRNFLDLSSELRGNPLQLCGFFQCE